MTTFSRRAKIRKMSHGAIIRRYRSADGEYAILQIQPADPERRPYWLLTKRMSHGEVPLGSRYRSRDAAEAAFARLAKRRIARCLKPSGSR